MEGSGEHDVLDAQLREGTGPYCRGELNAPVCFTVAGMPTSATQLAMKASVHLLASMLRIDTAFIHLVDLSMAVNRYMWPSEESGRGATRSTGMWRLCMPGPG